MIETKSWYLPQRLLRMSRSIIALSFMLVIISAFPSLTSMSTLASIFTTALETDTVYDDNEKIETVGKDIDAIQSILDDAMHDDPHYNKIKNIIMKINSVNAKIQHEKDDNGVKVNYGSVPSDEDGDQTTSGGSSNSNRNNSNNNNDNNNGNSKSRRKLSSKSSSKSSKDFPVNPLPAAKVCKTSQKKKYNVDKDGTVEVVENYTGSESWHATVVHASTCGDLLDQVNWCHQNSVPLRVAAAGWNYGYFVSPNFPLKDDDRTGVNIKLNGDFKKTISHTKDTVTVGAGIERGAIYAYLRQPDVNRDLMAGGECFTINTSQQAGALVANAVHDTNQQAFTPETVHSLEAVVFENNIAVIKEFSTKDGDAFYSFFGGFGLTGIIVSVTFKTVPKTWYHRVPYYLPGTVYAAALEVGVNGPANYTETIKKFGIQQQTEPDSDSLLTNSEVRGPGFYNLPKYKSSFTNFINDFMNKTNHAAEGDVVAYYGPFGLDSSVQGRPPADMMLDIDMRNDARYYIRATEQVPDFVVTWGEYVDVSALMNKDLTIGTGTGRQYSHNDVAYSDPNSNYAYDVQDSIMNYKWKNANINNQYPFPEGQDPYSPAQQNALTNQYWAFVENTIAHATGPNFIFGVSGVGAEFDVGNDDIYDFAKILRNSAYEFCVTQEPNCAGDLTMDIRSAKRSDTAFMSSFYQSDRIVIEIPGLPPKEEDFKKFVYLVKKRSEEKNIKFGMHPGKLYVHEQEMTHFIYDEDKRKRLTRIIQQHDPKGVFAPDRLRDLFIHR